MVEVAREGKLEQALEESVNGRGRAKVLTAHDKVNTLPRVIDNDGKVVACPDILPCHDLVTVEELCDTEDGAVGFLPRPGYFWKHVECGSRIESEPVCLAGTDAFFPLQRVEAAAGSRVGRIGMMGGSGEAREFLLDLSSRAEAGIEKAGIRELADGFLIGLPAF